MLYVDDPTVDYASAETQLKLVDWEEKLSRCYLCEESWFTPNTLTSWYDGLVKWVDSGDCSA